jgi:hypothetical protein
MNHTIAVSLVHGYTERDYNIGKEKLPALWVHDPNGRGAVHEYPFPPNVSDFFEYRDIISGQMPLANAQDFKKLARFG